MVRIPDNAKKVFQGILFDVYHWKQKMFDGSFETFEAVKRKPSVQIIAITPEKKVILLREEQPHSGSFITVPGGQVERDETPDEACRKELLEELGMESSDVTLWYEQSLGSKIEWRAYYYIAKNCTRVRAPELESGERIESYEVGFDEFLEEIDKREFRNKGFSDRIFRIKHTKGELEKFKKLLFD
jgi:ADP-ribose pyrophosphatase